MSEATSYRFENNIENKSLQRALHRQKERIKYDELMAAREGVVKNELLINQKAEWTEKLEEASAHRRLRTEKAAVKSEIAIAGKTLIAVRRAALRQLLDQEYAQFEEELRAQGNAFYFKRE
ncbi:uncharacterized protein C1orf189-like [Lytechinus variegatus]|uniref:uncharacterized protein C1orf189-like n=1 Tax=Lytechinus variegatus TaxID=7654 RepID=UPI001BB1D968|nr:uncharacterized protein C1orf189-like [Lytechinus variegatus]